MSEVNFDETVGAIVSQKPGLARVFEELGIDYCCGGKVHLKDVCAEQSLDLTTVQQKLTEGLQQLDANPVDVDAAAMSLTDLVDHIVSTHHTYLKAELPRLVAMAEKVASVHGDHDARLREVNDTFGGLAAELSSHMMKEENILFPMIRQLEVGVADAAGHCGSISAPINQMESEHAMAGAALASLQKLTDNHTPPEWACNTYRALLDGLLRFEQDLHRHIHKENNVLFPRAIELEKECSPAM
jgi:regulator of cell morphogenesis and NO signaling